MFFDTYQHSRDFHERASLAYDYPKDINFYTYIEDADKAKETVPANIANSHNWFYYESFLTSYEDKLILFTYIKNEQPKCHSLRIVKINEFSMTTRKWRNQKLHREKHKNFNGCGMVIYGEYPKPPDLDLDFDKNGKIVGVRGYGPLFNEVISKSLNYTFVYLLVKVYRNGSYNQNVKPIYYPAEEKFYKGTIGSSFEINGNSYRKLFSRKVKKFSITFPYFSRRYFYYLKICALHAV